MSTYDKIAELCKKNGISITGLEAELGFGRGSIGKMKKGSATSFDRLQKIANRLGTTVEYLVGEDDVQTDAHGTYYYNEETLKLAQELFDNHNLRILLDAAKNIDDKDVLLIYNIIKRMQETNSDE